MLHELFTGNLLNLFLTLSWCGAVLTAPSVLLQRAGKPSAALSWLFALFAVPALAVAAWWLIGRTHLQRKSRRRRFASQAMTRSLQDTRDQVMDDVTQVSAMQMASCLAPALPLDFQDSVFPATAGNRVRLLADTRHTHQAWFDLIDAAEHHLHALFYIWRDDHIGRSMRDRLANKAAQGVQVRVLVDAIGSFGLSEDFFRPLQEQGGEVARFMPIRLLSAAPTLNFRNHRKLLIADARHAYTGGVNVGDEYLHWQDIGIVLHGPGVSQLQEVFVDDWFFTTGEELSGSEYFREDAGHGSGLNLPATAICETIASGPHQAFNMTRDMVFLAVNQCRQRLWICTPYFIPGSALMMALRTAVYRGVDVRLFLPAQSDAPLVARASRVFYQELLEGGVSIHEYPGMLHAKALCLDDDAVIIGSANLDVRSFRLNFEVSTFITQPQLNQELSKLMRQVQQSSHAVTLEELKRTSLWRRLQDSVAHLLSPLL